MNITNLIIQLQNKLNSGTQVIDNLVAIKAIEKLKTGGVFYVDDFSELPSVENNTGKFYFVGRDESLYYNDGFKWNTLINPQINLSYSWGRNTYGNLGDNTTMCKSSPALVVGGISDWCQVSSGCEHTLGVRQNGTIWGWGRNTSVFSCPLGALGDGTNINRSSPVSVIGGFTDWCQVSAGTGHSLAVRQNGTAWAWGQGSNLGDGTTVDKSSPVLVAGGFTDWCQVSAGGATSHGIRQNGTLWGWGVGGRTIGDGTTVAKSSPVSVVGGFTDWCQVSGGSCHVLAVRQNGTAWSWGCNRYGMLGHGTATTCNTSSPVSIVGGFTDWCQVSAGNVHSLGVRRNGTLWAWGQNYRGQLGDGTTVDKSSPVSVIGGFTDWCQVNAGEGWFSHGVRQNGTLWGWGQNAFGQIGDGTCLSTFIGRSSPVSVIGGFTDWCQVTSGNCFTVAIRKRDLSS